VSYQGAFLTQANATNVKFTTGYTQLTMEGILRPSKIEPVDELIGRYLSGQASQLYARGAPGNQSSSYPLFQRFLSNLTLPGVLQGPARSIGREVLLHVDLQIIIDYILSNGSIEVPTQVLFHNPFNAQVAITGVGAYVNYHAISVGYSFTHRTSAYKPLHIIVPANSTVMSPEVPVTCKLSPFSCWWVLLKYFFCLSQWIHVDLIIYLLKSKQLLKHLNMAMLYLVNYPP
jgi:hypothetical protein